MSPSAPRARTSSSRRARRRRDVARFRRGAASRHSSAAPPPRARAGRRARDAPRRSTSASRARARPVVRERGETHEALRHIEMPRAPRHDLRAQMRDCLAHGNGVARRAGAWRPSRDTMLVRRAAPHPRARPARRAAPRRSCAAAIAARAAVRAPRRVARVESRAAHHRERRRGRREGPQIAHGERGVAVDHPVDHRERERGILAVGERAVRRAPRDRRLSRRGSAAA